MTEDQDPYHDVRCRREIAQVRDELIRYAARPDCTAPNLEAVIGALSVAIGFWRTGSYCHDRYRSPIRSAISLALLRCGPAPAHADLDDALFVDLPEWMRELAYPERFSDD